MPTKWKKIASTQSQEWMIGDNAHSASFTEMQVDTISGTDAAAVFDRRVPKGTDSANPTYTGVGFNSALAFHNRLQLTVRVDDIDNESGAVAYFLCFIEMSSDGRHWIQRSNPSNSHAQADADLALAVPTSFGAAPPTVMQTWSDACRGMSRGTGTSQVSGPLLAFVRLQMFWSSTMVSGHVRVYAHARDQRPRPS